jgi:hypothetical protein
MDDPDLIEQAAQVIDPEAFKIDASVSWVAADQERARDAARRLVAAGMLQHPTPPPSTKRQCAWWHDTKQCPEWNQEDSDYCDHHTTMRVTEFGTRFARWAKYPDDAALRSCREDTP